MNICILGPVWYIQFPKCLKFNMLQTKHLVLPPNILFRHFWAQYMTSQFPRLKKYIGIMLSPISLIPQILSPNLVIFTKKKIFWNSPTFFPLETTSTWFQIIYVAPGLLQRLLNYIQRHLFHLFPISSQREIYRHKTETSYLSIDKVPHRDLHVLLV